MIPGYEEDPNRRKYLATVVAVVAMMLAVGFVGGLVACWWVG